MCVTVRYESAFNSYLTQPFEIGYRHLKVAFCTNSQEALTEMARERMIYRSPQQQDKFEPLTLTQRSFHAIVGCLETMGYLTIITPFITAIIDKVLNKPFYPKGGADFRTHIEEGGDIDDEANWRTNPFFDLDSKNDPFYQGASWIE